MLRPFLAGTVTVAVVVAFPGDSAGQSVVDEPIAGGPAVTPQPRLEEWWFARHAETIGAMKGGEVDLLMVGDSITHNFDSVGAAVWARTFAPRRALNLGFGGDRTNHVLWRLEHLPRLETAPKGAVVMLGTNNICWGSDTPAEAAQGVQAVASKLNEHYPTMEILVLGVFPRRREPDHPHRREIEELNALLPDLLRGLETVRFLDIGSQFLDANGHLSEEMMPDTTHPSEKGHEVWAAAIEPELRRMLGEGVVLPIGDSEAGILAYLRERYDADGDGVIQRAEYGRGDDRFGELDGNADGVIDDRDVFGGFLSGGEMQTMLTTMVLTRYFSDDASAEQLSWGAMVDTFDRYDVDEDGVLTRDEFAALVEERPDEGGLGVFERMGGGFGSAGREQGLSEALADPFARLSGLGDPDDVDIIEKDALLEYFDEHDEDLDELLDLPAALADREQPGFSSVFEGAPEEVVAYDGTLRGPGVEPGAPAPDFTLSRVAGGPSVTLSHHFGKRPVALIFGSYT